MGDDMGSLRTKHAIYTNRRLSITIARRDGNVG